MICWSCEKNVEPATFCSGCRAILPIEGRSEHFALLGAPRKYEQDVGELERRYKEAARAVHPDKFARADARARRAAMERTVALNEAWRTLRDPVARAEYLLELEGIEVGGEEGTVRRSEAGRQKVPVPAALLAEMLEKQEALMEARLEGDAHTVAAMAQDMQARSDRALRLAAEALDAEPRRLDEAARELVAVRYYRRFLDSVNEGGASAPGAHHG